MSLPPRTSRTHALPFRTRARSAAAGVMLSALVASLVFALPARGAVGVSANWPSSTLERGSSAVVTGRTSSPLTVDAVLQQQVLGGWREIRRTDVQANGSFRLPIPTWWTSKRAYRVIATTDGGSNALGEASSTWTARVVPAYSPGGRKGQHTYGLTTPTRWDPCQVIGYRVHARQATKGWKRDVKGAMKRIREATGLRFAYRGTAGRIPQYGGNAWYPANTQIVIAWAKPSQSSLLRRYPGAEGVGMAQSSGGYYNGDGSSTYRIVKGAVVIDSRTKRRRGFGRGVTRGDVLLHEVGHTMGLSHVGSTKQIMYPYLTRGPARLGKGDRTGMEKRGARLGCLSNAPMSARVAGDQFTAMP